MASQMSPSVFETPLRRIQRDHSLSPEYNLHVKQRDATSSTSEIPVPTHQESRHTRAESSPTRVRRSLGKRPRSELPKTHDERRPPLSKKTRSAPDGTLKVGANVSNDDSIQTPELQKKGSHTPCGKWYRSPGWLRKHLGSCDNCQNINLKKAQAQDICETALNSKQQTYPELEETLAIKAADEQLGGKPGAILQVDRKAPEELGLGRDRVPSLHGTDDSTHQDSGLQTRKHNGYGSRYAPIITNKISNAVAPRSADKESPKANEKDGSDIVYATTLGLEDETNPEEALLTNSVGPQINATELHNKLRTILERGLTPNDVKGDIYIFFDPKQPKLHKIGRSKEANRRKGQLENQCDLSLTLVANIRVDYSFRTERLIQAYLLDLCKPYKCSVCDTNHGEWFEITKESAIVAVNRWAMFMIQENPYDPETRQLQPFITDLIKRRGHFFADADRKFETVREHWNRILSPPFLDRFQFKFNVVWHLLWKFYWPVNTMFAWTVAFAVSYHPVTFLFLAASVIGTFISISDEYHRLRSSSMNPKKKSI